MWLKFMDVNLLVFAIHHHHHPLSLLSFIFLWRFGSGFVSRMKEGIRRAAEGTRDDDCWIGMFVLVFIYFSLPHSFRLFRKKKV